jgi:S-adenosyl-L-methionine hydrolase (adenosine-forming)
MARVGTLIVLFTDFGLHGPYTGQVKAVLHQMAPGIPVVDLFADAPVGNPKPSAQLVQRRAGKTRSWDID